MKIFLSSSRDNRAVAACVMDDLEARGHEITLRWDKVTRAEYTSEEMRDGGMASYEAVLNCELYVLLLPCGINSSTELGIALTSGRHVLVLSETTFSYEEADPFASFFYFFPGVIRILTGGADVATIIDIHCDVRMWQEQGDPHCEGCQHECPGCG
jgi:hypothetical protein